VWNGLGSPLHVFTLIIQSEREMSLEIVQLRGRDCVELFLPSHDYDYLHNRLSKPKFKYFVHTSWFRWIRLLSSTTIYHKSEPAFVNFVSPSYTKIADNLCCHFLTDITNRQHDYHTCVNKENFRLSRFTGTLLILVCKRNPHTATSCLTNGIVW
jgi:hypothetical protein